MPIRGSGAAAAGGAVLSSLVPPFANAFYVDSGQTPNNPNGSIAAPYTSISAALTAIGVPLSSAAANQLVVIHVAPGTYTENLTIPAYRNLEIRADNVDQKVTGNLTWANVAGGGAVAPTSARLVVHGIALTGTVTLTDDATVSATVYLSTDENDGTVTNAGNIVATGATLITSIFLLHVSVGSITSVASASGAALFAKGASFGSYVGPQLGSIATPLLNCVLTGNVYTLSNNASYLRGCQFTGTPVMSGATLLRSDGPSWASFVKSGGSVTSPMPVTIPGGYSAAEVKGANLTDAALTLSLNGSGATAGFTQGGNHYTLPAATLTANRVITLGAGGTFSAIDSILITRLDATAFTLTIQDDAATTLVVMPVSKMSAALFTFNGTHFVCTMPGNQ